MGGKPGLVVHHNEPARMVLARHTMHRRDWVAAAFAQVRRYPCTYRRMIGEGNRERCASAPTTQQH